MFCPEKKERKTDEGLSLTSGLGWDSFVETIEISLFPVFLSNQMNLIKTTWTITNDRWFSGEDSLSSNNKKVLLRDRKRHTACCIASTRSDFLPQGKYPGPSRGVPQSCPDQGVYPSTGWRYPSPSWGVAHSKIGVPQSQLGRVPLSWPGSIPVLGYPSPAGIGVPPWEGTWDQRPGKEPGTGVPSFGWTDTCENITFPILLMRAVRRTGSLVKPWVARVNWENQFSCPNVCYDGHIVSRRWFGLGKQGH